MSVAIDIDGVAGGDRPGSRRWEAGTRRVAERWEDERAPRPRHGTRRSVDTRRPGGRPLAYGAARVPVSRVPHARTGQEVGWGAMVVAALAATLVVFGFFGLAQWTAGDSVPDRTEVVQVRAGESLGDVAERVVPGGAVEQVVARIAELNALSGSGLHPGQSLIVPVSSAG
ncbi:LysM peptidoglycan-binding domain-containing protein [Rhodococcus sp. NPDC003348]